MRTGHRNCPQTFPVCRFSLALLELIVLYNKTLSVVHLVNSKSDSSKLLKLKGGSGNYYSQIRQKCGWPGDPGFTSGVESEIPLQAEWARVLKPVESDANYSALLSE